MHSPKDTDVVCPVTGFKGSNPHEPVKPIIGPSLPPITSRPQAAKKPPAPTAASPTLRFQVTDESPATAMSTDSDDETAKQTFTKDDESAHSETSSFADTSATGASTVGNQMMLFQNAIELIPVLPHQHDSLVFGDKDEALEHFKKMSAIYGDMLSHAFIGLIVMECHGQRIIFSNSFARFVFNLTELQITGQSVHDLVPGHFKERHKELVRNYIRQWNDKKIQPPSKIVGENFHETDAEVYKNDRLVTFPIKVKVMPCKLGMKSDGTPAFLLAQIQDIRYLSELEKESRIYKSVNEDVADGTVVADLDGRVLYLNPAITSMFGWEVNYARQAKMEIHQLLRPKERESHRLRFQKFRDQVLSSRNLSFESSPVINQTTTQIAVTIDGKEKSVRLRVRFNRDPKGGDAHILIAIITDADLMVTREELYSKINAAVLPVKLSRWFATTKSDNDFHALRKNTAIVIVDIIKSTETVSRFTDDELVDYIKTFNAACRKYATDFNLEIVKLLGDGAILISNETCEHDVESERAQRSIYFAMGLLLWGLANKYGLRIGMSFGDIQDCIFNLTGERKSWDILGINVNQAKRLETNALKGTPAPVDDQTSAIQISGDLLKKASKSQRECFIEVEQVESDTNGFSPRRESKVDSAREEFSDSLVSMHSTVKRPMTCYRNFKLLDEKEIAQAATKIATSIRIKKEQAEALARDQARSGLRLMQAV